MVSVVSYRVYRVKSWRPHSPIVNPLLLKAVTTHMYIAMPSCTYIERLVTSQSQLRYSWLFTASGQVHSTVCWPNAWGPHHQNLQSHLLQAGTTYIRSRLHVIAFFWQQSHLRHRIERTSYSHPPWELNGMYRDSSGAWQWQQTELYALKGVSAVVKHPFTSRHCTSRWPIPWVCKRC